MRTLKNIILLVLFLGVSAAFSQELTISGTDAGPYVPGSSISALLNISDAACIRPGNTFTLHLSDQNGNFATERQIGSFTGFYATFVNGTIPANTPVGTGYRLRIKSNTPGLVSSASVPFEIKAGAASDAKLSSTGINTANPDVFGSCNGVSNYPVYLKNESSNASSISATITNELTKTVAAEIVFNESDESFTAQLAHYTIFVKAVSALGTVATRSYLIINNRALTAFGTSGSNTVCLPDAVLNFNVGISGPDGIENNFPGSIYKITWGDNSEDQLTICDIRRSNGKISHEYKVNSCGKTITSGSNTVVNAFGINISLQNAYCGNSGTPVSTFAKVINKPENSFSNPDACLNKPVTFLNTSLSGQDPNSVNASCDNPAVRYTWYVDGVRVPGATNVPKSFALVYTFTTTGNHTVRLESTTNTPCVAAPIEKAICIQEPPRPSFNLTGSSNNQITICAGTTVKPVNTSFTDNLCGTNTTNWRVTGGGGVTFANGTTAASEQPEILFSQPGIYKIRLAIISSACSTILTEEQTVVVNSIPTVTMSPGIILCNLSSYSFNNTTAGPTRTNFTGTSEPLSDTYTWTVTGGNFSYIGETGPNSKFPVIDFTEYSTYTVTVTHKNNCGTSSASQTLKFEPAPVVDAGTYPALCFLGDLSLNGSVTGSVNSYEWVGGTGTFSPDRKTLNAIYTPSQAERQAGQVNLTLRALTSLAAPCNVVEGFTTINIIDANRISSAAGKTICTNKAVDYLPVANVEGSTFSWKVISSTFATGFNDGSGSRINDQLVNTNATENAEVVYRIIPSFDGCDGEPFDLKITITPNPVLTAQALSDNICSGQLSTISISSNLTGTLYTWTSTASNPLITGQTENLTPSAITEISSVLQNKSGVAGKVTYTITPISANGCLGAAQIVEITVKASAENVIGGPQTICEGTAPVTITGNVPLGGDGPYTYQWQMSTDGGISWANINGAQAADYTPGILSQTTVYQRLVNSFACPGSIPNNSNMATITVNPDAQAEFRFLADVGCAPFRLEATNITATPYPDRNSTYTWYANDVLIGTGIDFPGYTINNTDEKVTVKLVTSSVFGCKESEMSHDFQTQNALISKFSQNITESCGATSVTFVNQSSPMVNTSFYWDFGNGQTSNEASPAPVTFSPDPLGADKTYTITLTASSACNSGVTVTSTVLIKGPALSVFSPDKTVSCSPMQVTFRNTSPETANTTYYYDFGDGSPLLETTDRNSVSHIFTAGPEGNNYTVTMRAKNDCGENSSQHIIRVTPATVAAELVVNGNDQMGCAPFTATFFNNSSGGTSYHYDFGDGKSITTFSAPERVTHLYTTAGTYTVTLTAISNCSRVSTTEEILVLAQPQPGFSITGMQNVNAELQFTNSTTEGVSYLWDFGDGNTSQEVSPTHTYVR
ncbi:MAG: PKD domain-containing protein, partial [Sphingobacteriales bacterium]